MDDISQLRSRVAAALRRLSSAAEEQQKYGLRLNDVVRIVEGALSRQRSELDASRSRTATLQSELDTAETKLSEIELRSTALAAQSIQLAAQNEQLRGMVMTLLQLIEGRSATTPMNDALHRIELELRGFLAEQAVAAPVPQPAAAVAADEDLLVDINAAPEDDVGSVVAEPAAETSPVAELIRRISEETEEIAPSAQRKA